MRLYHFLALGSQVTDRPYGTLLQGTRQAHRDQQAPATAKGGELRVKRNPPLAAPALCDSRYLSAKLRREAAKARVVKPLDIKCITGRVNVTIGPQGIRCKLPSIGPMGDSVGGRRGDIRGFSPASRRRMQRLLMTVDFTSCAAYLCGFTLPDVFDEAKHQAHWKALRKRLYRRLPGLVGVIWKKEWKRRLSGDRKGDWAPHYHMLLFLPVSVSEGMLWRILRQLWNEVVAPDDVDHLLHGCDVRAVDVPKGHAVAKLMLYISKYLAKTLDEADMPTGRLWGVWGKPPTAATSASMPWDQYVILMRRLRKWGRRSRYLRKASALWRGMSVWGNGYAIWDLTRGLAVEYSSP